MLLVVALAACSADEAAPNRRVDLPGTLYFMRGDMLMRYERDNTTPIARGIYPSPSALPDGRIVAIASRGDGETGEQLALVSPNGRVARVGPVAAQVRDPAVTADGIVVAMNVDGQSDLYRVALEGPTTRLTNDAAGNYHPASIGTDIVYVSSRDGDAEIYRGTQRLTSFYKDDFDPVPSPDGSLIVFSSDREGPARLFVMNADGTNLRRVTERATGTAADVDESDAMFSRDGALLAYLAGGHVFVRSNGIDHDFGAGTAAAFSPDSAWLAIARPNGDVVAASLRGSEQILVASDAQLPRWF